MKDPESNSATLFETDTNTAFTVNKSIIPPQSISNIEIRLKNSKSATYLLEHLPSLPQNNLAGAKCFIENTKGQSQYLQVMNISKAAVTLRANTPVALVCSILNKDIFSQPVKTSYTPPPEVIFVDKPTDDQKQLKHIDFDLSSSDLSEKQKEIMYHFLQSHRKVFEADLSELGKTSYKIETENVPPI